MATTKYIVDNVSGQTISEINSTIINTDTISATTISGGILYGDGSNLTGIFTQDTFVTGGTYSNGTATFTNNTGGTFNVTGFTTGNTLQQVLVNGNTSGGNDIIMSENDNIIFKYAGYNNNINTNPLTSNRVILFPDNSGTVALLSDIQTFTGGTVSGVTNFTNGLTANTISATTISATTLYGDGSNLTGINGISPTTGSWTLSAGTNTVSFTVTAGQSYVMWVNGNIPNGIVNWNATVTLSNSNVPAIGVQYGWYYLAGNELVLTSIPSQIVGTAGSIVTTSPVVSNSNTFTFGITNNTVSSQIVYYGYIKIS